MAENTKDGESMATGKIVKNIDDFNRIVSAATAKQKVNKNPTVQTYTAFAGPTQSGATTDFIGPTPAKQTTQYDTPIGPTQQKTKAKAPVVDTKSEIAAALKKYTDGQAAQAKIDTGKYITDQTNALNTLTEAQKASRQTALKDAYNKSQTGLNNQEGTINTNYKTGISTLRQRLNELVPKFQDNRNMASAQSAQAGQALAEKLAASGNAFGGQSVRDNVGLQTTLSNNLNAQNIAESNLKADYANQENTLTQEQINALNAIANNRQQLTQSYGSDLEKALAEIEAAKTSELMNLNDRGMNYNIQNNQINSASNQQNFANVLAAIAAKGQIDTTDLNNALNQAQTTGYYNPNANAGTPTVNYDPNNIQAKINELKAINPSDPNIAALEKIRYDKIMSDPALKAQYGDQYKTTQQKQAEAQQKLNDLEYAMRDAQQKAAADPNSTENLIKAEQLKQLQEQTKQIQAIDPTLANQENQLKLDQIRAQIEQIKSGTAQNYAQTEKIKNTPVSKTATKSNESDYYSNWVNEVSNEDGESLYKNLAENAEGYQDAMGPANYQKAISYAQNKYYQSVVDRWRDDTEALRQELQSKSDYYKQVLGMNNYNKLMNLN